MRGSFKPYVLTALVTALLVGSPFIYLRHLERPRIVEGVWLWQFEGSMFYEGAMPPNPCDLLKTRGSWLFSEPEQVLGEYDYRKEYPSSGEHISQYGSFRIEAFAVTFAGNKRYDLLGTGHLGGWTSEFEVYKIIKAVPISDLRCELPYP